MWVNEAILKKAVICDYTKGGHAPVAVLFSGGLDSMILAASLYECLNPKCGYYTHFVFYKT
ncbi:hypothetical protein LguiB_017864 [Lonicera macranthoides]